MRPSKIVKRVLLAAVILVVVLNWTWGRLPAEPSPPTGSKFAKIGDQRIHYLETPGREPAVLMIHGLPGTWGDWDYVVDELPGRRTIAIDRPGFGYSSGGYSSFEDQLKTINAFAHELKLKRPVIAGHSYGGTLALAYANTYPKQVRSIVAVDPGVDSDGMETFQKLLARATKVLQWPIVRPLADLTFSQLMRTAAADSGDKEAFDPDPVNEQHKQRLLELNMKSEDLKAYADEVLGFDDVLESLEDRYASITTPTWILQGRDDKLVSTEAVTSVARQIPGADYKIVSGGHMINYTNPRAVAKAITEASR